MKNRYVLYNHAIVPRESLSISPEGWFSIAGQSIRQTLFASGNRIPFLKPWLEELRMRFESVGWTLPDEFRLPDFRLKLEKLLNRNRLFKGSHIHLLITPIYPNTGVDPGPGFTCIGLTEEIEFDYFPLNQKGLSIGVSERYHNTTDPYVSSMIRSPLRSIMIRQEADANGWDEILLTDPDGFLSEASDSNLFLKIKDQLITPSPATHCFPRILTGVVKGLIPLTGLTLLERPNILPAELLLADELFLTDDRHGIRWILGYGNKRYFRKISTLLEEELTLLIRSTDQFQAGSSG